MLTEELSDSESKKFNWTDSEVFLSIIYSFNYATKLLQHRELERHVLNLFLNGGQRW